tara:strand:+ start:194 stop:1354 length:1161 start_codon:yes stop_codon:yes gene_type:complete
MRNEKPNIILTILDGTKLDILKRNNIFKSLEESSVLFPNLVTPAPYTMPSIYSIFTGLYPKNHGNNAYLKTPKQNHYTITDYMNSLKYKTYGSVCSISESYLPIKNFDYIQTYDEFKDDITQKHIQLVDEAYNKKRGEAFFLYLHHPGTHKGLVKNIVKNYSEFDENIFGEDSLLKKINQKQSNEIANYFEAIMSSIKKRDDNPLIITMSDHGTTSGERVGEYMYGVYCFNYTIKSYAYLTFPSENLILPKIINDYCSTLDLMPTILDYLKIEKNNPVDGISLLQKIVGDDRKVIEDRFLISETGGVTGPFPSPYRPNVYSCINYPWKLIYYTKTGKFEYFNINDDPNELNPLSYKKGTFKECYNKMMEYIFSNYRMESSEYYHRI